MDKNRKFSLRSIWAKFENFEGVFKEFFWTVSGQNFTMIQQRSHFMDAESMQETLNIFNFITAHAILMKLTTDIYLNKVFHLAKSWSVIHRVQEGVNKKNHKMSQQISYLATFRPFLNTSIKTIANAFPPLFGFFLAKETYPKAAQNHSLCWYKNIWKLNTGELQIRNQ